MVYSAVTPRPQSENAAAVRDESPVDQEQRHRCSDAKQPRCPRTHQSAAVTASAATAEQVTRRY